MARKTLNPAKWNYSHSLSGSVEDYELLTVLLYSRVDGRPENFFHVWYPRKA